MKSFLQTEREQGGWRFWLLWVVVTTIGFIFGLSIEMMLNGHPNFYVAVPFAALGQGYILNRHISIYLPWAVGTALFWLLGAMIGGQLLDMIVLGDTLIEQILRLVVTSALGGLLAGIPQWFFMRDWLPQVGLWWLLVSTISWAVLILPGVIVGTILMQMITKDKVPMDGRRYELSGQY
ncbi:MAG: hypothetical protein Phog2KO_18650 [Phototrophicaceae bacterium]